MFSWGGGGRQCLVSAPPLLYLMLHSAHHKDSISIMTLGNWNGPGAQLSGAQLSAPKKWTVGPQGLICLEPADVLPFLLSLLALFGGVPNIGVKMAPKSQ